MPLDPVGNISLSLQIVILFLLILGLPFFRGQKGQRDPKNLIVHGYLTVTALVLHTILILIVMVPSFASGIPEFADMTIISTFNVLSHAILGTIAEILGLVIITGWLIKGPKKMACWKYKKYMPATFIIWVIALVNGAIVHILGMI